MAIWIMTLSADAPCQCSTFSGILITSPFLMTCAGFPFSWYQPWPSVTISTCPLGWVCQLVLAPGSNVTLPIAKLLLESFGSSGIRYASPVKYPLVSFSPLGKIEVLFAVVMVSVLKLFLQAINDNPVNDNKRKWYSFILY